MSYQCLTRYDTTGYNLRLHHANRHTTMRLVPRIFASLRDTLWRGTARPAATQAKDNTGECLARHAACCDWLCFGHASTSMLGCRIPLSRQCLRARPCFPSPALTRKRRPAFTKPLSEPLPLSLSSILLPPSLSRSLSPCTCFSEATTFDAFST